MEQYTTALERYHYGFRYFLLEKDDMKNGPGLRAVLWTAGCSHVCPGCQNPFTHDPNAGMDFTLEEQSKLFEYLKNPYVAGLTLSGGDPLHIRNRNGVGRLVTEVRKYFPDKSIWLYTGYNVRDVRNGELVFDRDSGGEEPFILPYSHDLDVVVDGRFYEKIRQQDLKSGQDPKWVGSSNQRLIDVKNTIADKEICLWQQPSYAPKRISYEELKNIGKEVAL